MIKKLMVTSVAIVLALMGCDPKAGGGSGGGGNKPPPAVGGGQLPPGTAPSYVANLAAINARGQEVHRSFNCHITGYAHGKIVEVTDEKTGTKTLYNQVIAGLRTPESIRIKNYGGVHLIMLSCTMIGQSGDTFFLEVTTADQRRQAPQTDAIDQRLVRAGKNRAEVHTTIVAIA